MTSIDCKKQFSTKDEHRKKILLCFLHFKKHLRVLTAILTVEFEFLAIFWSVNTQLSELRLHHSDETTKWIAPYSFSHFFPPDIR